MSAIQLLRRSLGDHINYGPLPNIHSTEELIRTNLEVRAWAQEAFKGNDALLRESFVLLESSMADRGVGGMQSNYRCRLRLPSAHDKPNKYTTWSVENGELSLVRSGRQGRLRRPTFTTASLKS
jgi:hypothetical protein